MVAVRVWLSPSTSVIDVESNVTEVTAIGAGSFSQDSSAIAQNTEKINLIVFILFFSMPSNSQMKADNKNKAWEL